MKITHARAINACIDFDAICECWETLREHSCTFAAVATSSDGDKIAKMVDWLADLTEEWVETGVKAGLIPADGEEGGLSEKENRCIRKRGTENHRARQNAR